MFKRCVVFVFLLSLRFCRAGVAGVAPIGKPLVEPPEFGDRVRDTDKEPYWIPGAFPNIFQNQTGDLHNYVEKEPDMLTWGPHIMRSRGWYAQDLFIWQSFVHISLSLTLVTPLRDSRNSWIHMISRWPHTQPAPPQQLSLVTTSTDPTHTPSPMILFSGKCCGWVRPAGLHILPTAYYVGVLDKLQ